MSGETDSSGTPFRKAPLGIEAKIDGDDFRDIVQTIHDVGSTHRKKKEIYLFYCIIQSATGIAFLTCAS